VQSEQLRLVFRGQLVDLSLDFVDVIAIVGPLPAFIVEAKAFFQRYCSEELFYQRIRCAYVFVVGYPASLVHF